jgi:hypothetical protein
MAIFANILRAKASEHYELLPEHSRDEEKAATTGQAQLETTSKNRMLSFTILLLVLSNTVTWMSAHYFVEAKRSSKADSRTPYGIVSEAKYALNPSNINRLQLGLRGTHH